MTETTSTGGGAVCLANGFIPLPVRPAESNSSVAGLIYKFKIRKFEVFWNRRVLSKTWNPVAVPPREAPWEDGVMLLAASGRVDSDSSMHQFEASVGHRTRQIVMWD